MLKQLPLRSFLIGVFFMSIIGVYLALTSGNMRENMGENMPKNMPESMIAACQKTVNQYAIYTDLKEATKLGGIFTPTAIFMLPDRTLKGRAEIIADMGTRPKNRGSLHHITTINIEPIDDKTAIGMSYAVVQIWETQKQDAPLTDVSKMAQASVIYMDEFAYEDGVCLFASRKVKVRVLDAPNNL